MTEEKQVPPYSNRGAQNTNEFGLRACVDWVQVTFLGITNPFDVITLLGLENDSFEAKKIGKFGYTSHLRYGNIAIYFSGEKDHVHLEMTGQGCRQYESLNVHDWSALFGLFLMLEVNFTRLDLAIDDFEGYFKVNTLYQKVRRTHALSKFKSWKYIHSGKISKRESTGYTLYLGDPTSRLQVRFYDKFLERQSKGKVMEDGIEFWNRTEIQMRDERSQAAAILIALESHTVGQLVSGTLKNYINFVNPKKLKNGKIDSNRSRWTVADFWKKFLGDVEPISLSQVAPDRTIESTKQWFEKSITPSLAVLMDAFDYDIDLLNKWILEGRDRLSDRHKDMLKRFKENQKTLEDIKKDQNQNGSDLNDNITN